MCSCIVGSWIKKNFKQNARLMMGGIWYLLIWLSLTICIVANWNAAISFTFFSQFNGLNLLFVCWILICALPLLSLTSKIKLGSFEADLAVFSDKALEKAKEELASSSIQYNKEINNEEAMKIINDVSEQIK